MSPLVIPAVVELGTKLIRHFFPDTEKQKEAEAELNKLAAQGNLQLMIEEVGLAKLQLEINRQEAAHASIFVAGWRPFIGWSCGLAIFCYYVPRFIVGVYFWGKSVLVLMNTGTLAALPPMPDMGVGDLIALVTVLLGASTLRTIEKQLGVSRDSLKE